MGRSLHLGSQCHPQSRTQRQILAMTMGDESLFAAMALPVIVGPILETIEKRDLAAAQTLRAAFTKVEHVHPGFTYDLVKSLLHKLDIAGELDMCEALLRLEGRHHSEEFMISRPEAPYRDLNNKAANLKRILSRIPDEIDERRKFLDTIKEIANAIRHLLDTVSNVSSMVEGQNSKQELEQKKREFVKYSKRFSDTLKAYFKGSQKVQVFMAANHLIHQTNLIMKTVKSFS